MATRQPAKAPKGYRPDAFPPFAVTVDVVILTVVAGRLEVLLVKRDADPYAGSWALPGGFKRTDETLDEAAVRELSEETGVDAARRLTQFGCYGDPGRDPRMDVVTVAYFAIVADVGTLSAGTDAADAGLWPAVDVVDGRLDVAFDHRRIVTDAVERTRIDLETSDLATAFVAPEFTIRELRGVYEAVWDTEFDPANFRRSVLKDAAVRPTGGRALSGSDGGRPSELYRASASWDATSPVQRPRRVPGPPPAAAKRRRGR